MLEVVSTLRPYVELGYFVAGIALVVGVLAALRQARLLKQDIETRSRRAADEKAIEVGSRYLTHLVQITNAQYELMKNSNVLPYKGAIGDFSPRSISSVRINPDDIKLMQSELDILNELEIISAYCVTGVADERTAFKIFSRSFCNVVERRYDTISLSRREVGQAYWSNIVALYQMWRPRLRSAEISAQIETLRNQQAGLSHV